MLQSNRLHVHPLAILQRWLAPLLPGLHLRWLAVAQMILERVTHLGQPAHKREESRVRRIIEPMLAGGSIDKVPPLDREYLVDLGLLRRDGPGGLVVANPISREVLPRALASGPQDSLPRIAPTWLRSDGALDPQALLAAFLAFWRRHGEPEPLAGPRPFPVGVGWRTMRVASDARSRIE